MEKETRNANQGIPVLNVEEKKTDSKTFIHQFKLVTENSERIYSSEKEAIQNYKKELRKALEILESVHEENELLDDQITVQLFIRTINPETKEKSNWIAYRSLEIEAETEEKDEDQGSAFENLVDHLLSGAEDDLGSSETDDLPSDESEVAADQNFQIQYRVKGDGMELITTDEREARLWYKKEIRTLEEREEAEELELTEDFSVELQTRLLNLSTGKATAWEIDSSQTFFAEEDDDDDSDEE
jgi:hypothetical protein